MPIAGFTKALGLTLATLCCGLTVAKAQTPPAANYYVGPGGSDTNAGTSAAAPFATINKALSLCTGGQTVAVASGSYAAVTDQKVRSQMVMVIGYGATKPVINPDGSNRSIYLPGGQNLTFDNFKCTGRTWMHYRYDSTLGQDQYSQFITIKNCDLSGGVNGAVTIRSGARDILIENNYIHDSFNGIDGPNQPIQCYRITIRNNRIENLTNDGITFGRWDDVLITGNTIRNAIDVNDVNHNDCIQMYGPSDGVTITNNVLSRSGSQLMILKPDIGPLNDLLVQNNLIYNCEAVAVQMARISQARFINNTIWHGTWTSQRMVNGQLQNISVTGLGGLWLRALGGVAATDTIVANNALSSFSIMEGAAASFADYNFVPGSSPGAHDVHGSPGFFDVAAENFRPATTSPLLDAGTATYAPPADLIGASRVPPPTIGAYEGAYQPGLLSYDGFNYAVTANVNTAADSPSDLGWTGTTWSGTSDIVSPGLSYSTLPVEANALKFNSNVSATRSIDPASMPNDYSVTGTDSIKRLGKAGTTLWLSFLLRADDADADGTKTGGLNLLGSPTGGTAKLFIGDTGTGSNWSVKSVGGVSANGSSPITVGQTIFIVVKISFVSGSNNDQVSLYVNPALGTSPPSPTATLIGQDVGNFDRVEFKGNRLLTGDEVRIGTSWNAVIGQ